MRNHEEQRKADWQVYVRENEAVLVNFLDHTSVKGVRLSSKSRQVLEELTELLCQDSYVPQKKKDFKKEFATAAYATTVRLCAECSGQIFRLEDIQDMVHAKIQKS